MAIPDHCHHSAWVGDRTIEAIRNRNPKSPFFLISSFPDPHHPYHVPEPWDRMYSADDVVPPVGIEGERQKLPPFMERTYSSDVLLSGRRLKTAMPEAHYLDILAHTYGMVSLIDKHVGRILDALETEGLENDTVVCFISDHGDLMGDHGLLNKGPFHFEGLIRVPMIWRFPGRFPASTASGLASLLDVVPTLLDLAGAPAPEGPSASEARDQPPALPGRSLGPMLAGDTRSVQDSVLVENDEDYLGLRVRTLVTETEKVTTYTGHRGAEPYGEYFDLSADPAECDNLWDRPDRQSRKQDLIVDLHHRLTETDSALPRRLSHA
jgi:arylsulfatase A-like enzyme